MKEGYKRAYIYLFMYLALIGIMLLVIREKNKSVLTVGVFYGSNWEVPGTKQQEVIDRAIDIFHEKYPDMKVSYEKGIPYSSYSNWLCGKIFNGNEPDVYLVLSEDFEKLASTRSLKELDEYMADDESISAKDFFANAYYAGRFKDHQYVLPYACNPTMMFVNKTILDREGIDVPENDWGWTDFTHICKLITKDTTGDGVIDQFGYCGYDWTHAIYSNSCTIFSTDGRSVNVREEPFIQSLRYMRRLRDTNLKYDVTSADFDLGHVAFQPLSFSEYLTYMPYPWKIKKYSNFEWTCIRMPAGVQGANISSMDVLSAGISSRTNKPDEAWEFLKILTTNEAVQTLVIEKTSAASTLKKIMISDEVLNIIANGTPGKSNIDFNIINNVIEESVIERKFPKYNDIMNQLNPMINDVLVTDEDTTVTLFKIKDAMNELLNENDMIKAY